MDNQRKREKQREKERKREREREIKHLSVHQWLRSAIPDSQPTSPTGFLFLKLPPPPCAVLLVKVQMHCSFIGKSRLRKTPMLGAVLAKSLIGEWSHRFGCMDLRLAWPERPKYVLNMP